MRAHSVQIRVYCACDLCQFSTIRHLMSQGSNTGHCVVFLAAIYPWSPALGCSLHRGGLIVASAWLYECASSGRLVHINHSWCWKFTFEKGRFQVPWTQLLKEGKTSEVSASVVVKVVYLFTFLLSEYFHLQLIQLINYVTFVLEPWKGKQ